MSTAYYSQYFAHAPTLKRASGSIDSLSRSIANARVDLNPHQVDFDQVEQRNSQFFDEEVIKIDRWSDDLKQGLEREIKEIDQEIRQARKAAALAQSLAAKLEAQKQIKALESARNRKRRDLFDAQDTIDLQRGELIGKIERQMQQWTTVQTLFVIHWEVR